MLTHGITSLYSTAQCQLTTTTNQRSNYSIIYEGAGRAIASLENFLRPPPRPGRSHISADQNVFYCNFTTETLANCNKASTKKSPAHHRNCSPLNRPNSDYSNLADGWSSCNFRGAFTLSYPLKTDVSRGPQGISDGPGPLGPHRNSTTATNIS